MNVEELDGLVPQDYGIERRINMKGPERLFVYGPDLEQNTTLQWDTVRNWESDIEYIRADLVPQMIESHDVDEYYKEKEN